MSGAASNSVELLDRLRSVVCQGELRAGSAPDAICGAVPQFVAEPATESEIAALLRFAAEAGVQVAPCGGGTKLEWGSAPKSVDVLLRTARLNRIVEHVPDDMTVTVEAGTRLSQLQAVLAEHRQRLALDPLWPERATVGGVVSANDSGAMRLRYGSVRDLIIGATVVLSNGTIARCGGKVVKNVAGYDMQKLVTGALGTLGVITRAVFRLHPLPEQSRTLRFAFAEPKTANAFMLAVCDSYAVPAAMQMSCGAEGGIDVDVEIEGCAAGVEAQCDTVCKLATSPASERNPKLWLAREELWSDPGSTICKLSTLPDRIAEVVESVRAWASRADWKLVAYSTGLVWLRVDGAESANAARLIASLRQQLAAHRGSLVVLRAPAALRAEIDIWGEVGNSLPLMKRIKEQFDPGAIMNRGRFVGGI
jgi:glycolate oxidase FAD binding subunit